MSALRDAVIENAPLVLALGGLVIGFLFGLAVYRTNYCAMGSLADIHNFGDYRRFRAWLLAAATALIGATLLDAPASSISGARCTWRPRSTGSAIWRAG